MKMSIRQVLAVIVVAVSLASGQAFSVEETKGESGFRKIAYYNGAEHVPGEILVKLNSNGLKTFGITSLSKTLSSFGMEAFHPVLNTIPLFVVRLRAAEQLREILQKLNSDPNVAYAEPNYLYRTSTAGIRRLSNDPHFHKFWGLHNTGQKIGNQVGIPGSDIDAVRAWDLTTGDSSVVVAVIDTGVDYLHEDLAANLWVNRAEIPDNNIDDDGNGFVDDIRGWNFYGKNNNPMDDNEHGTHVAGTIGAVGDNGKGVVGINWNVSIMPLKAFDREGYGTTEDAIAAIDYAVKMGAQVLNNSWGGDGYSHAMAEVITVAEQKGVIFVAAAGNEEADNDRKPNYPSNYPHSNVVAVAAGDNRDQLADFSNWGIEQVDILAPGVGIYSTFPENSYGYLDGTSMATPHVVGAIALLWGYDPNLTMQEVIERILKGSDEVPTVRRRIKSGGRLNIYNALMGIEGARSPEVNPQTWALFGYAISSPHQYDNNQELTWTIHHPGAQFIAVHFSKLSTEENYDKVRITNEEGLVYDLLHGEQDNRWSAAVSGETLVVHFRSDNSVTGYGFDIDQYAVFPAREE
ncbi:MAG: S8 family serine peptidase [Deltaproteobacteria bacterium]|nr:S8 family serine peptidase [Deltaproteobacteria bacterium]